MLTAGSIPTTVQAPWQAAGGDGQRQRRGTRRGAAGSPPRAATLTPHPEQLPRPLGRRSRGASRVLHLLPATLRRSAVLPKLIQRTRRAMGAASGRQSDCQALHGRPCCNASAGSALMAAARALIVPAPTCLPIAVGHDPPGRRTASSHSCKLLTSTFTRRTAHQPSTIGSGVVCSAADGRQRAVRNPDCPTKPALHRRRCGCQGGCYRRIGA